MADFDDYPVFTPGNTPLAQPKGAPHSDFDDYPVFTPGAPSTLGAGTPTAERRALAERRFIDQQAAAEEFTRLPTTSRMKAVGRAFASGIPLAGRLVDENNPDLRTFRAGYPFSSGALETIGHTAPYMAVGAGLPSLFSTVPRSMLTSGAIESGDTALGDGDTAEIIGSGLVGAGLGAVGPLITKGVTPRSQGASFADRFNNAAYRVRRARANPQFEENAAVMRVLSTLGDDPEELARLNMDARQAIARTALPDILAPPLRIPNLNITDSPFLNQLGTGGIAGGLLNSALSGHLAAPELSHIALGAAGATLGPRFINQAINAANRGLVTRAGKDVISPAVRRYMNNTLLSDEARAILNALSSGGLNEIIPDQLQLVSPQTLLGR